MYYCFVSSISINKWFCSTVYLCYTDMLCTLFLKYEKNYLNGTAFLLLRFIIWTCAYVFFFFSVCLLSNTLVYKICPDSSKLTDFFKVLILKRMKQKRIEKSKSEPNNASNTALQNQTSTVATIVSLLSKRLLLCLHTQ